MPGPAQQRTAADQFDHVSLTPEAMRAPSVLSTLRPYSAARASTAGETAARHLGFVVGSMLVVGVAWPMSRWLAGTQAAQLKVAAPWLALLLVFGISVGRARGFSWQRIGAELDPPQGGLMLFALCLVLVAPLLWAWLHRLRQHRYQAVRPPGWSLQTGGSCGSTKIYSRRAFVAFLT
jgi:hypothetical protein